MRTLAFYSSLVAALFSFTITSSADNRGTTGADFLKIGLGAQSAGMGEAYTARLGDPNAVYYNPAGLSEMALTTLSATHLNWIADTQYEAIAFAGPLLGVGTLGASVFLLHMPEIPGLNESGLDTGMLNVYDLGIQFSFARDISPFVGIPGLSAGVSLKVLHRQLAGLSASGGAVDIGSIYKILSNWTVGLSVLNLGYLSSFDSASESLPIMFRMGTNYNLQLAKEHVVVGALDLVQAVDNKFKANIGLEYSFASIVYLRGGYKIGYDTDGLQAGAGVQWNNLSVDYALKNMGLFGYTHFITASVGFGATIKAARVDRVKVMLNEAESQFTQSNYDAALKVVNDAIMVDSDNKRALHLKEKLNTVLQMLQMPSTPDPDQKDDKLQVNPDGEPLTPDELEELSETKPEEVQQ